MTQAREPFLEAVREAEIEIWEGTLSIMAKTVSSACCFWDCRERLLGTFHCDHIEIFVGEELIASSRS
jgi:hypothetical protein